MAALLVVLGAACVAASPAAPPPFDGARAYEHLRQLVALGPRPAGSPAAASTRAYIKAELTRLGLEPREQAFVAATPIGPIAMVNVSARIPGTGRGRLVIGGHYDTKLFREFPFVGANDGGSSTAVLIELARALKGRTGLPTIELLFLDGEESTGEWQGTDHTYGSRHYVEAARKDGSLHDIRAFILVDMVGDRDLVIKRESRSTPWLTDAIWKAA
ncbi:MAG: M28 family peptidase, partial [Acidobacteriota bacterium]